MNSTKENILQILRRELPHLHEKYGVKQIALFGSFAKGTQSKSSDIDLLVKFDRPLGFEFIGLAYHLEEVLGAKVDLVTFDHFEESKENPRYKHIAVDVERSLAYV